MKDVWEAEDHTSPSELSANSFQNVSSQNNVCICKSKLNPYASPFVNNDDSNISNKFPVSTSININNQNGTESVETHLSSITYENVGAISSNVTALPIITIMLNNTNVDMLLDTGSSISLLDFNLFNAIKGNIKARFISRQVQISTLNSKIHFFSCVDIPFKLFNNSFRHPFFTTLMSSNKFKGILGMDFLLKNHMTIIPHEYKINFKGSDLPLKNSLESPESLNMFENSVNVVNRPHIVVSNDKPNIDNQPNADVNCVSQVFLRNKVILHPQECQFFPVTTNSMFSTKNFLFECSKSLNDKIKCPDSIINFDVVKNLDSKVQTFNVYLSNSSNETVHLNKGLHIGEINDVHHIEEVINNVEIDNDITYEMINTISPSDEILNERKKEIKCSDFNLSHLNELQKNKLTGILMENYAAFSKSLKTLGHTDKIKPTISLISDFPVRTLPFPIPQALQDEAYSQIKELEQAGLIEKSATNWASPMLLVKKKADKDGKISHRLVLDLRLVNSLIKNNAYPLPKISDIIHNLSKYKFFSVLDLSKAYWQIDLPEKYQEILAFTTPWGTYKNKRLVFGLKSASSWFQALIDSIIQETDMQNVFAYQDDLLVATNSFEETIKCISIILKTLAKHNLTLSPEKCSFHAEAINYLGFHISQNVIKPVSSNIVKITSFPTPKNKRQLKKFIGMANFYRGLIKNYADLVHPLTSLTSSKVKFDWGEEQELAFKKLQETFFNQPFVRLPNFDKPFFLNTDASKNALGGVLLQSFDNKLCPVAYFSKSLSPTEKRYSALKLELMALHRSVIAFKQHLYNRNFTVFSDSKPLQFYKRTSSPADVTTRWLMELSEYSFVFKHIPGKDNVLADYLSRLEESPTKMDVTSKPSILTDQSQILPFTFNEEVYNQNVSFSDKVDNHDQQNVCNHIGSFDDSENEITIDEIRNEQLNDGNLSVIINKIKDRKFDKSTSFFYLHKDFKVLCRNNKNRRQKSSTHIFVVPDSLKYKVIKIFHFNHLGIKKCTSFITNRYYWKGMFKDIQNYINSCETCNTNKNFQIRPAPLQKSFIPTSPANVISIDFVGPFGNNQHILTIIDHFSRHLELFIVSNMSAQTVVNCIFEYISIYGRPSLVLSDNGKCFVAEAFKIFNKSLGIKLVHSTPYHPQGNAISERINSSLRSSISTLLNEGHTLKTAVLIHKHLYNNSVHPATGYSPSLLHFGREHSLLFDTFERDLQLLNLDKSFYVDKLLKSLNDIFKKSYDKLSYTQSKQNNVINQNKNLRSLNVNDIVYVKSRNKLNNKATGPFRIIARNSNVTYTIQRINDNHAPTFKIHINRLRHVPSRVNKNVVEKSQTLPNPNMEQNIVSPNMTTSVETDNPNTVSKHKYFLRSRK